MAFDDSILKSLHEPTDSNTCIIHFGMISCNAACGWNVSLSRTVVAVRMPCPRGCDTSRLFT